MKTRGTPRTKQEDTTTSINEMEIKVKELRELKRKADELQAQIDGIQDTIKAEMTDRCTDTLTGSDWKITWKAVTSQRLDTAALKKAKPELVAMFTKASTTRRFTLA